MTMTHRHQRAERLAQFQQLADALPEDAKRFRVTLGSYKAVPKTLDGKPVMQMRADGTQVPTEHYPTRVLRDKDAPALNPLGAGKGNDGLTIEQIKARMGVIERAQDDPTQARVILTPASESHHIVHVDDVSAEKLAQMKRDGFEPCFVQQTSPDKRNVLLTAPKDPTLTPEQQREVGKALTQALNQRYGDADARNEVQPLRMPGFDNRKPKYQREDGSYPTIEIEHAKRGDCEKTRQLSRELGRDLAKTSPTWQQAQPSTRPAQPGQPGQPMQQAASGPSKAQQAYAAHVSYLRENADRMHIHLRDNGTLDQSSIDVLAAQRMKLAGWKRDDIAQAVRAGCNEIRREHGDAPKHDPARYAAQLAQRVDATDLSKWSKQEKFLQQIERAAGVSEQDRKAGDKEQAREADRSAQNDRAQGDTARAGGDAPDRQDAESKEKLEQQERIEREQREREEAERQHQLGM